MGTLAVRPLVSEEEFLALPESTDKIELIDGEVIVSPSPSYWHQEILGRVVTALRAWAGRQRRPITIGQAPLDVRFASGRILQPDAFVLFAPIPRKHEGPIDRVIDPAGVVERWTGPGLAEATVPRASLVSPLLPRFRLDLRRLFARGRRG